ncbi:MAG: methylmalonyl Co-A mutase-associated GTPase MeaB [Actinomycetota bacterium]
MARASVPALCLVERVLAGDRQAVAKLISLAEDGGPGMAPVMEAIFPHTGGAYVVGITGAPGAGKSTLCEALLGRIRSDGHRVAVLAVDPSSPFSGGALLGDRVRIQSHTADRGVFIRSMATRGHLGGLAVATPEAVRILDAAGWAYVLIETVGVGQSEVEVMKSADSTMVVVVPRWGDGVQASKAGLLEIGDLFVVNKADREGARETARELDQMLDLGPQRAWRPPVLETVATEGGGIDGVWSALKAHRAAQEASGELERRRYGRIAREISDLVAERVRSRVEADSAEALEALVARVGRRELSPRAAADRLLATLGFDGF